MTTPDEQWPTRPTGTDTMPIEPPPSGLALDGGDAPNPPDWHARYESERRRSRIFMLATALLGAGLLASLIFAAAQAQSGAGAGAGLEGPGGMAGRPFDGPGGAHGHHDFHGGGEPDVDGRHFEGQEFGESAPDTTLGG